MFAEKSRVIKYLKQTFHVYFYDIIFDCITLCWMPCINTLFYALIIIVNSGENICVNK